MNVRVAVFGLDDLREALKQLPPELNAEARREVRATTDAAANELRAVYPVKTGNLRRGVRTKFTEGPVMTSGKVLSTAPHAHLWEYGTVNRHTERGWNRGRMASQISRGLVAIAARRRRSLYRAIVAIVESAGFVVRAA